MAYNQELLVSSILALCMLTHADYDPFMDQIYFNINWPGATLPDADSVITEANSVVVTTLQNERYRCLLPDLSDEQHDKYGSSYAGPVEMDMLMPLFDQTSCSYRIETYWTYELCHGQHLRQYHEEKDPAEPDTVKKQEYFLGRYTREQLRKDREAAREEQRATREAGESKDTKKKVQLQKVEGIEIPYYPMQFSDGTKCDLTGSPRRTSVHYVCQAHGRGEIYEFKEISTCEYEIVVLTSLLCSHPSYSAQKDPVNNIECMSLDGSPSRPVSLQSLEKERKQNQQAGHGATGQEVVVKKDAIAKAESKVTYERPSHTTQTGPTAHDKSLLQDFLRGDYCLQGGTGWWKHEFCFGKKIIQFHQEKSSRTEILLGSWDEVSHRSWINEHPSKKPKPVKERKFITQHYQGGDICDLTGVPRSVEVKLKCKEGSTYTSSITIFLIEPHSCQYNLVVESFLLCDGIKEADSDGVMTVP